MGQQDCRNFLAPNFLAKTPVMNRRLSTTKRHWQENYAARRLPGLPECSCPEIFLPVPFRVFRGDSF